MKKNAKNLLDILNVEGISKTDILELAMKTRFMKRKPKKIDPYNFINLFCALAVMDTPSFNSIAARYSTDYSSIASKQAISKKINAECLDFFKSILALIIKTKFSRKETETMLFFNLYNRVLVQDSTIIKLPLRLFAIFSGVKNAKTSTCNARIQGVYDLISGSFLSFSIDPYSINDITTAPQLDVLKGDITLRDRGYFSIDEIQRHIDAKADCIYRYRTKTILINPKTGEHINLYKLLKKKRYLDMEVCLNNVRHTKVRLVAVPVSEDIVSRRRANAKKNFNRHNPSKEVLELMSWTIFITTIPKEKASFDNILALYSLRWRVEVIFKAWKSYAAFGKIHDISENHLRIMLTARFIMIVLYTHYVFLPWSHIIRSKFKREMSLLKLYCFLTKNVEQIVMLIDSLSNNNFNTAGKTLIKYCTYDKRIRLNFMQIYEIVALS